MACLLLMIAGAGEQNKPVCCWLATEQPGSPAISIKASNRASAMEGAAHEWLMHTAKKSIRICCL